MDKGKLPGGIWHSFLGQYQHWQSIYKTRGGLCNSPICFVLKYIMQPFPPLAAWFLLFFVYKECFVLSVDLLTHHDVKVRIATYLLWTVGHGWMFLTFWTFYKAMFTRETHWDEDALAQQLQKQTGIPKHQQPTHCVRCDILRPARAHHCSWCGRCVDKMDHHCPWIGRCVGRYNYKYFYLFLVHTVLGEILVLSYFSYVYHQRGLHWRQVNSDISILAALIFSESLLLAFHTFLLLTNFTTIEIVLCLIVKKKRKKGNQYSMGIKGNIEEVFGKNKWLWFFPVESKAPPGGHPSVDV